MTRTHFAPTVTDATGWGPVALKPKVDEHDTALDRIESCVREVLPGEDINAALSGYTGTVLLGPGLFNTAVPIIQPRWTRVVGAGGGATIVRATATMAALWRIGNGAPCDRTELADLNLQANNNAGIGLEYNIVGTTGNINGEPDGQSFAHNLYIDDATDKGVYMLGGDTQAWHLREIRVRRAANYGFHVTAPDGWITDCEATTTTAGGAGFLVAGSNGHYHGCKAWFCHGYGWNISGTRNVFTGCESQDTASHGWYVNFDKNTIVGCVADSAGRSDIGGTAGTADGFYLETGLKYTNLSGCMSFDRSQTVTAQQRYGYNMSASTWNIGRATAGTTAATGTGTTPPVIGALCGGDTAAQGAATSFMNVSGLLNLR